jgi:hypothetical protein
LGSLRSTTAREREKLSLVPFSNTSLQIGHLEIGAEIGEVIVEDFGEAGDGEFGEGIYVEIGEATYVEIGEVIGDNVGEVIGAESDLEFSNRLEELISESQRPTGR